MTTRTGRIKPGTLLRITTSSPSLNIARNNWDCGDICVIEKPEQSFYNFQVRVLRTGKMIYGSAGQSTSSMVIVSEPDDAQDR